MGATGAGTSPRPGIVNTVLQSKIAAVRPLFEDANDQQHPVVFEFEGRKFVICNARCYSAAGEPHTKFACKSLGGLYSDFSLLSDFPTQRDGVTDDGVQIWRPHGGWPLSRDYGLKEGDVIVFGEVAVKILKC